VWGSANWADGYLGFHYYPKIEYGMAHISLDTDTFTVKSDVGMQIKNANLYDITNISKTGNWSDYITKDASQIIKYIYAPLFNGTYWRIGKPLPGKGGQGASSGSGFYPNYDSNRWATYGEWGLMPFNPYPPTYNVSDWHWLTAAHGGGGNKFAADWSSSGQTRTKKGEGGGGSAMSYIKITEYRINGAEFYNYGNLNK
jgi:hypothetical protein